jgi:hypothetical protein
MLKLLSRDEFRESVFDRDGHKCVMCGKPAQDAHHIIERKLWPDFGYYLENGASVCGDCHILCEQTVIDCQTLRDKCGIREIVLPPHMYPDLEYDKWGNQIQPNGRRLYGELMDDESVIKILKSGNMLSIFDEKIKFPRTYHLFSSPGGTEDDRRMETEEGLEKQDVIVTIKMDGENTSMTRESCYARSRETESHWSRDLVRSLHGKLSYEIPEGWRICGENLYAQHSIAYKNLDSYFIGFSVWNRLTCLSWLETVEYLGILDIPVVPVIYSGIYDKKLIDKAFKDYMATSTDGVEGYVVRVSRAFKMSEYRKVVGKYVRENHNQCHGNWHRNAKKNELKNS